MEGVTKNLKLRDRKLTEHYLSLAISEDFNPVYSDYFYQVLKCKIKVKL